MYWKLTSFSGSVGIPAYEPVFYGSAVHAMPSCADHSIHIERVNTGAGALHELVDSTRI
jgi:hypothetical protein